jgi:hypothetical protein
MSKLDQGLKRWSSRFERFIRYFGFVIIDTSSQGDDSIADDFIKNNPYGDLVRPVFTNKWVVREHLHYYGTKGWFQVFAGDSTHQPFIIDPSKGKIVTSDMDPDRVIKVPEECRPDFEFDLVTALQDEAGISTTATDQFFPDKTNIRKCFSLPQYGSDVVKFDFYDKTDKFIYRFQRSIDEIPKDRIIFIRFDIGVTRDNTGLAITYFNKWKVYDQDKKIRLPDINVPLAVGINRFEGDETPITSMFEFVMDLNQIFEIGGVSMDQFGSRQFLQDLKRENIPNRYLSVDRTDEAYVYCKSLANAGCLHIANNTKCEKEFCELRRVGLNKVDHPPVSDGGSKDISDAVAGAVYDLYNNIDLAGQLSIKYKVHKYTEQFKERSLRQDNEFQDRWGSIYG